jgi:hypothetical protein
MAIDTRRVWRFAVSMLLAMQLASTAPLASASARATADPLPTGAITAIRLHDQGAGAGRPVTFALPFAEGAANPNTNFVVTTAQGQVLPSQWNRLASWRTDGSTLHGAITFLTPNSGGNSGVYYVRPGEPTAGPSITPSDVLASQFDARVTVTIGSTTYSLSARSLLDGSATPRQNYTHFSGPLASEFVVGGPLRVNGTGSGHGTLQAYFYIRAFKRPVERVFVTVALENTGAFNPLTDIPGATVDVRVGNASLGDFPKANFTIYSDIRYVKRAWWNSTDDLWVQHDLAYVSDTKLMPKYRQVQMSSSVLASYPQVSEWNQRRILSEPTLESGGAKPEIAPYDSWTAAYMVSGDRRAWNAMRAAVDEYGMMVSNHSAGVVHARDEETGHPLDLTVKGVVGRIWFSSGGPDVLNATRNGRPVAQADIAHWPSIGYLPYLLTAESNELENVQHSAVQPWLNEAPGGATGRIPNRPLKWLQTRGMAWALREIINGAVVTPDHHPLRRALQTSATHALSQYSSAGQAADPQKSTGLWMVGSYATPYNNNTGLAFWMDDFMTWAVGSAYERGWKAELDANGFWFWKAKGVVGRFGTNASTEYCWTQAAVYNTEVRPTQSSPIYGTWGEIFKRNYPDISSCPAIGTAGIGTDRNSTDYGAQVAAGLAVAASTGVAGASAAWGIYEARRKTWGFDFNVSPEWAIEARTGAAEVVRPNPPLNLSVR